jgi:serine/threonine protein kinase
MRTYSPGDEPIPGYRLIEQLGQGSFGVVWRAEGPGGVLVAMKVISNLNGIHAIREWQSLQNVMNLKQANLVEIYGVWLKDEKGQVLRADEVRAWIPPEVDVTAPVTETSSVPPAAPRKAIWAGDKRGEKPTPAAHILEGATLQAEDEPQTADGARGSTAADSSQPGESPGSGPHPSEATGGTGPAQESASGKDSTGSKESTPSGSRSKWSKVGGVPPLELVSAMTLGEGTLMSRLKQCQTQVHRGIPRPELLRYMMEAARGLGYLNDRKMHHCDVKPENMLLVGGSVKVCDYGSALRTIYSAESRTHQGYTEQYAAPEQLSGRKVKLHASTDMYALALTYYALRTGKYPWGDLSTEPIAVVKYGEKFDFSALSKLSRYPYEWQVIRRALKRDPEERYASTVEFVETLEAAARREEEATRARRRRRIRNVALAVMAFLLIGTGAGVWINRDQLSPWLPFNSNEDRFKSLVGGTSDELMRAIDIVNQSQPAIAPQEVARRVADGIERTRTKKPADLERVLDKVLTLKKAYQEGLHQAVVEASQEHFQKKLADQIARGEFAPVLEAVASHRGLGAWSLSDKVADGLVATWVGGGRAKLSEVKHDPDQAGASVGPLAALASALSDDSARRTEIDSAVNEQLRAWLESAETLLGDVPALSRARDEFRFIAASANSYLQARSDAPAEICAARGIAQVGELAARFRLEKEQRSQLLQPLAAISEADLQSSPAAQARRMLLARASDPSHDADLVSDRFLMIELPMLRSLPPGWEQETLDEIKKRAVAEAKQQHASGKLANVDAVLRELQDDRLTLDFARDALATAASSSQEAAFTQALELAGQRLSTLPEKLTQPADEMARVALRSWLTLLKADTPTPAQVTGAVQAFERWDAAIAGDSRGELWYGDFAQCVARRPGRWPKELLTAAIAELEDARVTSSGRIDRHLTALALRSQRLFVLSVAPEPTEEELAQSAQDSGRLVAAQRDEDTAIVVSRFIDPPVMVDALWLESNLAPLVLTGAASPAIAPDLIESLERLSAYVKDQPAAGAADDGGVLAYLQYVVDISRVIARTPGDDLHAALPVPPATNQWLATPRRRAVAAALLLDLAEKSARTPEFTRDINLTGHGSFVLQLPFLKRAQDWAASGTRQRLAADALAALAMFYAAGEQEWDAIRTSAQAALSDRETCQQVINRQQYSHLLLAYAGALQHDAQPDAQLVVGLLAEVLRRECDPFDGSNGCLSDLALYDQVVEPAVKLIEAAVLDKSAAAAGDVATVYGSQGALLERDTAREIAGKHHQSPEEPDVYDPELLFAAMLTAFQKAAACENDPALCLRWLAGEAYAIDAQAEFRLDKNPPSQAEKFDALCLALADIAQRMRSQSPPGEHFAIAGVQGLIASYRAQDSNELGKPEMEEAHCREAYESLNRAIVAAKADPQGNTPWGAYWRSAYVVTLSQICLQQSWNLPWGPAHQQKVQEAIAMAKVAASDPLGSSASRCRGLIALGSAYEDYALHLGCVAFFQQAEDTFTEARDGAGDAYLRLRAEGELQRVKMRRYNYDIRRSGLGDQAFATLTAEMEGVRDRMQVRGLNGWAHNLSFWLGELYRQFPPGDPQSRATAYAKAEAIFADLAKHASGEKKAKRLRIAADCALARAKAADEDLLLNRQALADAQRHLDELNASEEFLTTAEDRLRLVKLRLNVWGLDGKTDEQRYVKLQELVTACLGRVKNMAPSEQAQLEFDLQKLLFDTAPKNRSRPQRAGEAVDACGDILASAAAAGFWRPDQLSRNEIQRLSMEAFQLWENPPMDPAEKIENEWRVYELVRKLIETADQLERELGVLKCCAAEGEPTRGDDVKGYTAAAETVVEREFCVRLLADPIRNRAVAARNRGDQPTYDAALKAMHWMKSMLENSKDRLPMEPKRCAEFKQRITATYLPELRSLISTLSK